LKSEKVKKGESEKVCYREDTFTFTFSLFHFSASLSNFRKQTATSRKIIFKRII